MASVFTSADRIAENALAFAVADRFPVEPGHVLICPKREIGSWFSATAAEHAAMLELLAEMRERLVKERNPAGVRILINDGSAQHIPHLHLHLIPYSGPDVRR